MNMLVMKKAAKLASWASFGGSTKASKRKKTTGMNGIAMVQRSQAMARVAEGTPEDNAGGYTKRDGRMKEVPASGEVCWKDRRRAGSCRNLFPFAVEAARGLVLNLANGVPLLAMT